MPNMGLRRITSGSSFGYRYHYRYRVFSQHITCLELSRGWARRGAACSPPYEFVGQLDLDVTAHTRRSGTRLSSSNSFLATQRRRYKAPRSPLEISASECAGRLSDPAT